jgi:hypothetical protein
MKTFSFVFLLLLWTQLSWGKDITIAVTTELQHRDPVELQLLDEWEVYAGVYDTLVQYDVNEGFTGILAEKWAFDPVAKTITFKIRPQAKFSDASQITAEDVAFSFRRVLYLDKDKSQLLSRCLSGSQINLHSPNEPHPDIRVIDKTTLVLGPLKCGETLLNEIANVNYGIVSKASLDEHFKTKQDSPVSGLFTYRAINGAFVLTQNLQNWRWNQNLDKPPGTIHFVRFDDKDFLKDGASIQALRISNPEVLKRAQELGYHTKLSLPIMTWFMAPSKIPQGKEKWVNSILDDINNHIDLTKIQYFENNRLEQSSNQFFPDEFNCDRAAANREKKTVGAIKRGEIELKILGHPSGESNAFSEELTEELRELGYRINPKDAPSKKILTLNLRRQFLGDSVINIMDMVFRVFKTVPDPKREMIKKLELMERSPKSDQTKMLHNVCEKFYHFHHVPIAHRSYAFASKDEQMLDVFSKVTGNMVLEQFTKLKDGL